MRALRRLLLLLVGCAGCSLVIDGELISIHCEDDDALGPPACPEHQRCVKNICVSGQAAAPTLGSRCGHDDDCAVGDICLDPTMFDGFGPPVCSRPCCSSSDCDPESSFVCWAPAQGGGNFCLAAAALERTAIGKKEPGVSCDGAGDCRSGVCTHGRCEDPCCIGANCAASKGQCQFGETTSGHGFTCEPAASGRELYASCSSDDQCESGICLEVEGKLRCSMQCCTSSDCGTIGDDKLPVVCDYVTHDDTLVRACANIVPAAGAGTVGDPCHHDKDCRSARCVKGIKGGFTCQDVCCIASDCRDPMLFACLPRPSPDGEDHSSALRCERK